MKWKKMTALIIQQWDLKPAVDLFFSKIWCWLFLCFWNILLIFKRELLEPRKTSPAKGRRSTRWTPASETFPKLYRPAPMLLMESRNRPSLPIRVWRSDFVQYYIRGPRSSLAKRRFSRLWRSCSSPLCSHADWSCVCHSLVLFFQVFQTRLASFNDFISIFSGNSRSFSLSCNTEQRWIAVVKEQTRLFIDFILLCFIWVYFYCIEGCKYMVWSSNTMFLHIMLIIDRYVFLPTAVLRDLRTVKMKTCYLL